MTYKANFRVLERYEINLTLLGHLQNNQLQIQYFTSCLISSENELKSEFAYIFEPKSRLFRTPRSILSCYVCKCLRKCLLLYSQKHRYNTNQLTTKKTGCQALLEVVLYSAQLQSINWERQVRSGLTSKMKCVRSLHGIFLFRFKSTTHAALSTQTASLNLVTWKTQSAQQITKHIKHGTPIYSVTLLSLPYISK